MNPTPWLNWTKSHKRHFLNLLKTLWIIFGTFFNTLSLPLLVGSKKLLLVWLLYGHFPPIILYDFKFLNDKKKTKLKLCGSNDQTASFIDNAILKKQQFSVFRKFVRKVKCLWNLFRWEVLLTASSAQSSCSKNKRKNPFFTKSVSQDNMKQSIEHHSLYNDIASDYNFSSKSFIICTRAGPGCALFRSYKGCGRRRIQRGLSGIWILLPPAKKDSRGEN